MIIEGLVTTRDADGSPHVAPMGPIVNDNWTSLVLRPFQTSCTFANLVRDRQGVFHITDDVELLARAAVGAISTLPPLMSHAGVDVPIIASACRWYAFEVERIDDRDPRATIECQIVANGRIRDFVGFNRAKHAVVEAAILATRLEWLDPETIAGQMRDLAVIVEKTAGESERRAFEFLRHYIAEAGVHLSESSSSRPIASALPPVPPNPGSP